jgi:hypothetical protein
MAGASIRGVSCRTDRITASSGSSIEPCGLRRERGGSSAATSLAMVRLFSLSRRAISRWETPSAANSFAAAQLRFVLAAFALAVRPSLAERLRRPSPPRGSAPPRRSLSRIRSSSARRSRSASSADRASAAARRSSASAPRADSSSEARLALCSASLSGHVPACVGRASRPYGSTEDGGGYENS